MQSIFKDIDKFQLCYSKTIATNLYNVALTTPSSISLIQITLSYLSDKKKIVAALQNDDNALMNEDRERKIKQYDCRSRVLHFSNEFCAYLVFKKNMSTFVVRIIITAINLE